MSDWFCWEEYCSLEMQAEARHSSSFKGGSWGVRSHVKDTSPGHQNNLQNWVPYIKSNRTAGSNSGSNHFGGRGQWGWGGDRSGQGHGEGGMGAEVV